MKKVLSIMLAFALILSIGVLCVSADEEAEVYVTIVDKDGDLAVAVEKVTVTDTDDDGKLTINDALYCAHEAFYEGGAAEGYATVETQYGLSLDKLWGEANGGSYGYYLNGASAWSLTDEVKADDYLYAFVYTDLETWSDKFSTFDQFCGEVNADEGVELTLTYVSGYDDNYAPVFEPLAGADILVDDEETGIKTDEDGKAKVTFNSNGINLVSATAEDVLITPPVFKAIVTGAPEPENEDSTSGNTPVDGVEAPTQAPSGISGTAPSEAPTQAGTSAATPDQTSTSTTNTNAIQTGGLTTVIYIVLAMMILGFMIVTFRKKHED